VLEYEQATQIARAGAAAAAIVRGLGERPVQTLPQWNEAFAAGQNDDALPAPALPHSSLGAVQESAA